MSGTLYVVATPIGNLEDITLRAIRLLREASVIAAEDTRRTAKLLHHHGISTRTISFHEHNTRTRVPSLIARLLEGESVALVSDAGTPVLSDPGLELIQACIERGIPVDPVPGANAPFTALVASGFPPQPVTILGFAPTRSKDRITWLNGVSQVPHTVIFFDVPHRIRETMTEAAAIFGERPIVVARELTKVHQEIIRGSARDIAARLQAPRGEFTVVVGPAERGVETVTAPDDRALAAEFGVLTDNVGLSRRQAISRLSLKYGVSSREVYRRLEAAKGDLP